MRWAIFLVALLAASAAPAHDFWLQPHSYHFPTGEVVPVTLEVGHGPDRRRSTIPLRRIVRFAAIASDGSTLDLRSALHAGGYGTLRLDTPGAHLLVLETDNRAHSHLPAARFNDYLRDEGLTPALAHRARTGRTGADGIEIYSRVTKAIVHAGRRAAEDEALATLRLGLPLEIVPERSPHAVPRPSTLPIRVYYAHRALAGALVRLIDLDNDSRPAATRLTDRRGRAVFTLPESGRWLLNVVGTRALPRGGEADFETIFSSLSFGLDGAPGLETPPASHHRSGETPQ